MKDVRQQTHKVTAALHYVAGIKEANDMIPALCCGYHEVVKQGTEIINKHCLKTTGPKTAKYFMGMLQAAMSDTIDMICGNFGSLEICDQKIPAVMADLKGIINQGTEFNHTAVIPLLEIVARIDSGID